MKIFYKDKGEPYEKSDVLMLYERNLIISNKFFYLLNYFEVVLRNAVVQAIEISFRCNETNSWHENEVLFEALAVEGGIALKVCLIVLKRSSQIRLVK